MSQQTRHRSIRNLSPAELIRFIEKPPISFVINFDDLDELQEYMPSKIAVLDAFRAVEVTPDMLKYGIPINGLSLLQRCALFVWFNSFLPEDEKLIVPMCVIPNGFDWNDYQKIWYLYCMSPEICYWSLSEASEIVASRLWQVCEELINDEHLFSLLPLDVKSCETLDSLKQAVDAGSLEFSYDSKEPLELVRILEHLNFFKAHKRLDEICKVSDMNSLRERIVSNELHFVAVRYGFVREGISYGERLRIYALFQNTQFADKLVCPLLQAPPDEKHFRLYYQLLSNEPLVGEISDTAIYNLIRIFMEIKSKIDREYLADEDPLPPFILVDEGNQDIKSFLANVASLSKRELGQAVRTLVEVAFDKVPQAEGTDKVSKRYIDFLFSMVFGKHSGTASERLKVQLMMQKFFAGYSYLGQSSCSGKSRLALGEKLDTSTNRAVLNLYINCHQVSIANSQYPSPGKNSQKLVNYLTASVRTYEKMECILGRLLLWMRDKFLRKQGDCWIVKDGVTPKGYSIDFLEDFNVDLITDGFGRYKNVPFSVWKKELNFLKSIYLDSSKKVRVLFSVLFDEAARFVDTFIDVIGGNFANTLDRRHAEYFNSLSNSKISVFRLMRRILFFRKADFWYCPFMFSDTNTRLGNFLPALCREPSLRPGFTSDEIDATPASYMLFKPFLLFDTWNLFLNEYKNPMEPRNWLQYIQSLDYFVNLSFIGRPAWGALIKAGDLQNKPRNESLEAVVALAMAKLEYDFTDRPKMASREEFEGTSAAMAILGLTVGFNAIASVSHSENAVRRWMAMLTYYSSKTASICARYLQEPMLSIAACSFFTTYPARIMEEFRRSMSDSSVNVGEIGEFMARLLFMLCFLCCRVEDTYTNGELYGQAFFQSVAPRKVRDFLTMLVGPKGMEDIDAAVESQEKRKTWTGQEAKKIKLDSSAKYTKEVLNGVISFSHFLLPNAIKPYPRANLAFAVAHNAAFNMPGRSLGIDFVIPVVLQDGGLGSLNVQVKNEAEWSVSSKVQMNTWHKQVCADDIPSINILVNVYPNLESTAPKTHRPSKQKVSFLRCGRTREVLSIAMIGTDLPNFHGLAHDGRGNRLSNDHPLHGVIQEAAMMSRSQLAFIDSNDENSASPEESRQPFEILETDFNVGWPDWYTELVEQYISMLLYSVPEEVTAE